MNICAVDIGTTGTKTIIFDEKGRKRAFAYQEYPLITLSGNRIEQKAEDWWRTTAKTIKSCVEQIGKNEQVIAISLSTQGGALVVTDSNGNPIGNALSWMDLERSQPYIETLLNMRDSDWFYKMSGWKLSPSMCAAKLLWMYDNHPNLFKKGNKFLSTIDYVTFKLTGRFVIDPTNAATMQTFDITNQDWSEELLELLNVERSMWPEIVPCGQAIGELKKEALADCGLSGRVMLYSGGHDQFCAALGAGAVKSGDVMLSTGTAWVPLGVAQHVEHDFKHYPGIGNHIIPNMMGCMCNVSAGGVSLEWLRRLRAVSLPDGQYFKEGLVEIDREAIHRIKNTKDLMFYPYFLGTEYPGWNQLAKATLFGLSLEHDSYDVALAIMEGVAFQAAYAMEGYRNNGIDAREIKLLGGAARSSLWTQIISNINGLPITTFSEPNVACVGAAAIAGMGCGIFDSYTEGINKMVQSNTIPAPEGELREYYIDKYKRFKEGLEAIDGYYSYDRERVK